MDQLRQTTGNTQVSGISAGEPKTHILTVTLEDYFQGVALADAIERRQWPHFETRFDQNTLRTLDILDRFKVKATFFVMGWIAERRPDLVQEVVRRGHEIASSGYSKKSFRHFEADEFRSDLRRSQEALERASGKRVLGYRVADRHLGSRDLWALEVLAKEGYRYDSSFSPTGRSFYKQPWRRYVYSQQFEDRKFWELPLSAVDIGGFMLPVAGGNYFRQLPGPLVKAAIERWHTTKDSPLVLYFRVWDFDPDQPRISSASWTAALRHYRNPDKVPLLLNDFLRKYRFTSAADFLGLVPAVIETRSPAASHAGNSACMLAAPAGDRAAGPNENCPITIVVPCFNEESSLPYLANILQGVERELNRTYRVYYVFVDDGSSDGTWQAMQRLFGDRPECTFVRQPRNMGVTAAILTGVRAAGTEVVCSIDCDCTYDPRQLRALIPLLTAEVDLVTASPYHPEGRVLKVPKWRLALSRGASSLYRIVLKESVYTYTSCFRVYRRSCVINVEVRESGFLGVAELLAEMSVRGARIVEHPATLDVRVLGRSKMKIIRTIAGHLKLLSRFGVLRIVAMLRGRNQDGKPLTHTAKPDKTVAAKAQ